MNKHAKIAWRFSIAYTIVILMAMVFQFFTSMHASSLKVADFAVLVLIFGVFFLAFKKNYRVFALLSFGWFCFSFITMIWEITTHFDGNIFWYVPLVLILTLHVILAYLSLRVTFASKTVTLQNTI
ncbi:MAG: hypothetical protein LLG04_02405 [Parachlamydia sp.]|nr:hypothetical protein [Parachlamydia sp.]